MAADRWLTRVHLYTNHVQFWRSPTELRKRCKFRSCILLLCSPSLQQWELTKGANTFFFPKAADFDGLAMQAHSSCCISVNSLQFAIILHAIDLYWKSALGDIKFSEKISVNSWNIDETVILRFPTNIWARTAELGIEKACKIIQKVAMYIL